VVECRDDHIDSVFRVAGHSCRADRSPQVLVRVAVRERAPSLRVPLSIVEGCQPVCSGVASASYSPTP